MSEKTYKYIYGPVPSWRLGSSLGIDPLSLNEKVCTFDCAYCQIRKTNLLTDERDVFVRVSDIVKEIDSLPRLKIDYMTFSGTGEPTLAKNLGQMIKALKKIRNEKIAVLTNSSLMYRKDVQEDLFAADFVVAKLDAATQNVFELVNQPIRTIKIDIIIKAIKDFKSCYHGKLALQIMFVAENKKSAKEIAEIAREIKPEEVQLNTPLRPCRVKPVTKAEMNGIKEDFIGLNVVSVYDVKKKTVRPISSSDTLKRRGKV
ncbi:MAG: radical SAM protein [Candidatus Omnitrophota bacterium]|nr:radical SAM protein [Candidatus Omnitrophota bacterium]MBU1894316.1 radical SAM protein [Candidatus Omnitrophota bacterium]